MRVNQERGGIFYGWYMVVVCFIVNFFIFGISVNTFTVYVKPIEEDLGWSRGDISFAMMLAPVAMGLAAPFIGRLIDKVGARLVMATGAAVVGVGSILLAKTQTQSYFYMIYIIAGVGQACATIIPISYVISNWFTIRRGKALGFVMTGTGLGAMVMVPVTTEIIIRWDWRVSYFVMGIIILFMVPLELLFIRTKPSDMGLLADGGLVSEGEPVVLEGLSPVEAIKTSSFKLVAAMMMLSGLVAMGVGVHLMAYLTDIGHTARMASYIIMAISALTVVGKIGMGFISDRWGIRRAVFLSYLIIGIGIFLLMGAKSLPMAFVFAVVYGFAIGSPLVLNPALTAECLGLKNFGAIFGILTLVNTFGVAIGAFLTGAIHDAAKSYMPAFTLFIVLTAVAGLCGMAARKAYTSEQPSSEGA